MYAALSATNEAILRTRAPEELFQRVCDAVVHGGGFKMAGAMLPDTDGWLRIAAIAGYHNKQPISTVKISIKAEFESGPGPGRNGLQNRTARRLERLQERLPE